MSNSSSMMTMLAIGLAVSPAIAQTSSALLVQASQAHARSEIKDEERLLKRAAAVSNPAEDRVDAEVRLANLAWRYHLDYEDGRKHLSVASGLGVKRTRAFLQLSRLETAALKFEQARAAAKQGLGAASNANEARNATERFASVVVEEIYATTDATGSLSPVQRGLVDEALTAMKKAVRQQPGVLGPARLELALAVMVDDGPSILEGWTSYYHLVSAEEASGILAQPGGALAKQLPHFHGDEASAPHRAQILEALARSGFLREAAFGARRVEAAPASLKDWLVYAEFSERTRRILDEEYRKSAIKKASPKAWHKTMMAAAEGAWNRWSWPDKPGPFDRGKFIKEANSRFGAHIRIDDAELFMGQDIRDDEITVTQYGATAKLRYVQMDGVISDGYRDWLTEGRESSGGWAENGSEGAMGAIVQVRPMYANAPIAAWEAMNDPALAAQEMEQTAKLSAGDDERARKDPYAYLPGLQARLSQRGRALTLERVKATGATGDALRPAFLLEFERAQEAFSIRAHEGRHAIDLASHPNLSSETLEYNAKLSQVVFAPDPFSAMAGILSPSVGQKGDSHGMADLAIMKKLMAWMEAHRDEIAGFNAERPTLPQLDLLTADQARAAFRSFDPLAQGH